MFADDALARRAMEKLRWPDGVRCVHCGSSDVAAVGGNTDAYREGLYNCRACRKQFTVTVGTIFERSKVPLGKWLQFIRLLNTNRRKNLSSSHLSSVCGLSPKTIARMKARVYPAIDAYTGPSSIFGQGIMKRIKDTRPLPPDLSGDDSKKRWHRWRKRHPLGEAIQSDGTFSLIFGSELKRADSTEKLLRLLLNAKKPKERIAARIPKAHRRRNIVHSP